MGQLTEREFTAEQSDFLDSFFLKNGQAYREIMSEKEFIQLRNGFEIGLGYAQRKLDAYAAYVAGKITQKELEEVINGNG